MFTATTDKIMPLAMVGSFAKPSGFNQNLYGRPFEMAMRDPLYREQYLDPAACFISEQDHCGLDIPVEGDTRFDLEVGGRPAARGQTCSITLKEAT